MKQPPSNQVPAESIESALRKILASKIFARSERHSRFLRFTVERALQGQADQLKEYFLGVEVFDRGEGFDPRTDSIVRTEATRLRSKLKGYYETEGRDDLLIIEFQKGSYCPRFRPREQVVDVDACPSVPEGKRTTTKFRFAPLWASAAFLGLMASLWLWWSKEKSLPLHPRQHLVSSFPGSHRAASFSPDSSMITFIDAVDGVPQVWVKNLTQGDPIRITSGALPARRPRWSPANDQIVFTLGRTAPPALRSESIWSVPPLGGVSRKIIEDGSNPSWSRDGTLLVFERRDEIWTAKADGSEQRKVEGIPTIDFLRAERMPSFSPDGSLIAFFQPEAGPRGDFWVISSVGGQARRLTFDVCQGGSPIWTPDGNFIVFSSERAGSMTLWKIPSSGGSPEPVLVSAGEDTDPEISHDGSKVIYTHTRNTFILTILDPFTKQTRELRETRQGLVAPSFSPSGERISFFSQESDGEVHVFVIDTDGRHLTPITRGKGERNTFPQWSSDSLVLYFYQQRPNTSLRKIPLSGGQSAEVLSGWNWDQHQGRVNPKGTSIVYTKLPKGIGATTMIRSLETGNETPLNLPLARLRWSGDGNFIAGVDSDFTKTREGDISICPAGSGPCKKLTKGYNPVWSRDDSHIYFLRVSEFTDGAELRRISREGRDEQWIADLRPLYPIGHMYDVSPKGEIVYVQFKPGKQELWLMDFFNR